MSDYIVALTTFENDDQATPVITAVVKEGLAACAQVVQIGSTYVWQDELVQDREVLVLFKTRGSLYQLLQDRIVELHPYETPEVLQVPVLGGFAPYLSWVDGNTRNG